MGIGGAAYGAAGSDEERFKASNISYFKAAGSPLKLKSIGAGPTFRTWMPSLGYCLCLRLSRDYLGDSDTSAEDVNSPGR
jgi:hypothetical protein